MNIISQLPNDIIDIIAEYTVYYYKLIYKIQFKSINWIAIAKNSRSIDLINDNLQLVIKELEKYSIADKYIFYQNLFKNENQKVLSLIKNNFFDEKNINLLAISPYDEILNFVNDKFHINYGHLEFENFIINLSQNPNPKAILILRRFINDPDKYYMRFLYEICSNLAKNSNVESSNLLLEIMETDSLSYNNKLMIFIESILINKSNRGLILIEKLQPFFVNNPQNRFIDRLCINIIENLLKHSNSKVINIIINMLDNDFNGIINILDVINYPSFSFYKSKWTYYILNHYGILNEYIYLLASSKDANILKLINDNLHLYNNKTYFWVYLARNPHDYAVNMILNNLDVINNLDKELIYHMFRDINYPKIIYTFAKNPNIRAINKIKELFINNSIIINNDFWSSIL